jgi:diguanylate cyclase (GGDEF)-like protein
MLKLLFRPPAADRAKLVALVLTTALFAVVGGEVNRRIFEHLLRADAKSTTEVWVGTLLNNTSELPAVISGKASAEQVLILLNGSIKVGDVYRYRLWDLEGRQIAFSERFSGIQAASSMVALCGEQSARAVLSGTTCTVLENRRTFGNPAHFAYSFVPIVQNGTVVGVLEVYVDLAEHFVLYRRALLLSWFVTAVTIVFAGGIPVFLVRRKMKAHRAAAEEAQFLADHDNLTGIANRRRLVEAAIAALAWSRRSGTQVAVLMLDLDHFKDINDSYGHAAGDELLRKFSHRISTAIREEDTVARLGGDEFVVLQVGIAQPMGAKALAERLLAVLAEPYDLAGVRVPCGSSIGVAIAPGDASEWDALLSRADAALYRAKNEGRKTVCFFQPGMNASLRERRCVELDVKQALDTKAFGLAYQPISSFHDGTILGFEALLRWPEGWVARYPQEFIPIAEECGLMPAIGAWVLETACKTAVAWQEPLKIAVNLSPAQFRQGDIVATVVHALQVSGLAAERLELEITESLWIENTDAVLEPLARLKHLGVSITLDDFGTGNSSLKYLWKFPFDRVKIDRSFVEEMERDPKAAAIVSTILALGTTLHLTITAEGVETSAQAKLLNDAGCEQAQGFLLGRPLSAASTDALIKAAEPCSGDREVRISPSPLVSPLISH